MTHKGFTLHFVTFSHNHKHKTRNGLDINQGTVFVMSVPEDISYSEIKMVLYKRFGHNYWVDYDYKEWLEGLVHSRALKVNYVSDEPNITNEVIQDYLFGMVV